MTAEDTALRVARWAAREMRGPLPEGDLADAAALREPGAELARAVGQLTVVTAARLRLAGPLLGDARPAGIAAALVAAAIGGHADADRAALVLRAAPVPARAADLLAAHGLVAPAVALLPRLRNRLVDRSPLTGVLDAPGPQTTANCESLLDRLRADAAARAVIALRFATPWASAAQARWRGESLAAIRHEDAAFVLDVYELALAHFGQEHEIRARAAWRCLLSGDDPAAAADAAAWWRGLAELEDATPRLLRDRPLLSVRGARTRRAGTNLFRRVRELEAA